MFQIEKRKLTENHSKKYDNNRSKTVGKKYLTGWCPIKLVRPIQRSLNQHMQLDLRTLSPFSEKTPFACLSGFFFLFCFHSIHLFHCSNNHFCRIFSFSALSLLPLPIGPPSRAFAWRWVCACTWSKYILILQICGNTSLV